MTAPIQMRVRCPYCGKWKPAPEVQHIGAVSVCVECLEWSRKAMDALTHGTWPTECQVCHTSTDLLAAEAEARGGQLQMAVVSKDGIYQVLCLTCARAYARKRLDLYGGTPYAKREGLE